MKQNWCQNGNVSKTIAESKILEGCMVTKSGIVKIHLENEAFLTTRNRHVRETIGTVQRSERCKIEEVGLK